MRPAIFLDRDGTLIEERGYLDDLAQISLFPFSVPALRDLSAAGYALVLVTNQAGVARGFFDEAFVRAAHEALDRMLRAQGVVMDGYYYCPHHPAGVIDGYRRECRCRKPAAGMIEDAVRDLGLDVARSWVIGDKWLDVELAARAGARGVLVRTGYGAWSEPDPPAGVEPAAVFDHLGDAARWILAQDAVPR